MTKYRLSKLSNVPYTTLNDLCNGKTCLEKCNAETVYRLSKELHVSIEELLAPCFVDSILENKSKSAVLDQLAALKKQRESTRKTAENRSHKNRDEQ